MAQHDMLSGNEMIESARQWFGSLGQWPDGKPSDTAKMIADTKQEDSDSYYGVQAVLAMLVAANEDCWPPLSTKAFAEGLSHPEIKEQVVRYATSVATVEAKLGR